jgi:lipid A 3-O-deacylase
MMRGICGIVFILMLSVSGVRAADLESRLPVSPWGVAPFDPVNRWEARFGVFAHGLNGAESDTVSLQGEVVSPRLFPSDGGFWSWAVPRFHVGGSVNLSGRTDFVYTGLTWTIPLTGSVFFEGALGPSVHNGSLVPGPNQQGLGCRVLVHASASLGYRLSPRWSVMATYEHLSNASGISGCGWNRALDNVGIRVGYAF